MVVGLLSSAGLLRFVPLLEELEGVGDGTESIGPAEEDLRKDMLEVESNGSVKR